jgi:hypothetical protein
MAPIVHGLEQQFGKQVDFLYLDVADPRVAEAKAQFGFRATPHFFLINGKGAVLKEWQGVTDAELLEDGLRSAAAEAR